MTKRTSFLAASCVIVGAAIAYVTIARAVPPSTGYNAARGEDPAIWQSNSQAQVQEMIDKHIDDPKAMYRLINESYGKKQETYVAKELMRRLQKKESPQQDPQLTVVTAYAVVQAAGDGSRALWQGGTLESKSLVFSRASVFSMVTPDIWKGLDDPALMVMAAVARNEKLKETVDENMKPHPPEDTLPVIDLCRRATLIEPKWADGHYWYGRMLLEYFWDFEPEERAGKRDLLLTAKTELLKAAQLDAGLRSDSYWQLAFVLEILGQPKQALSYLDQAVQTRRSGYALNPALIEKTRQRLKGEVAAQ